ncbi:MAG: response regulator [Deltaproteobacteria bacterium]|jgi:CheY-like chemotaxis protein|nr:response regulator [Deltaproteobacteria bacterium]
MKKVLIVEDSKLVRSFFTKTLKRYEDKFEVTTAENGVDAIGLMNKSLPDLVMTDLDMPVMDGFELLVYMNKNHPDMPMFVMTAKGSPEVEEKINALGSIRYFEKPVDVDILAECIMDELGSGAKGQLQGISLASFLQLIEIENKTCTLTVSAVGRKGTLTCLKGELTNAEVGELKGLKAAHEMVSWDTASIEISNTASNMDREINEPLMGIIMEGTRQKDEKSAG